MDKKIRKNIISLLEKNFENEILDKENSFLTRELKKIINFSKSWKLLEKEIKDCLEINISSKSEEDIIKEEINDIEKKKDFLIRNVEWSISNIEDHYQKYSNENCILEIRSGAGGNEAKLFVKNIFQMYLKFIEKKKWKIELMNSRVDYLGGFSFVSFLVKGKEAYDILKSESGVHRVQRVPETENKGRVQTSTVTVVVFPELDDISIKIEDKDIRVDTYRSSGAGGQHVNTTDSAVRITHIPTGIFTTSQDGRSQNENKKYALITLKSLLYEKYKNDQGNKIDLIRNDAIGNSDRSEKIRTYNFQQNRVTDHRIGFQTNKLNNFINGEIEELCEKLLEFKKVSDKLFMIEKINSLIREIEKEKKNV